MAPLRWGIAGCGKISNDFAAALFTLGDTEHKLIAAAARDVNSAEKFAKNFAMRRHYGSYEELCQDSEIDIIYVGTITMMHYSICKMALQHNKHVLSEMSLTLMQKQTEELIQLAREKKRFLQEAVCTRFFPAMKKLRNDVKNGVIGDAKLVTAGFGWEGPEVALVRKQGGGSVVWLALVPIQLAIAVYGPEMPEKIHAVAAINAQGADTTCAITLQYKNGGIAQLSTSLESDIPNEGHIFGNKGSIVLPSPAHTPAALVVNGVTEDHPLPTVKVALSYPNSEGMIYQAQEVRECTNKGLFESPLFTHKESVTGAAIIDEVLRQIGVSYTDLY